MPKSETRISLSDRWKAVQVGLDNLPFGKTSMGLSDFRGCPVPDGLFTPGTVVRNLDLGQAVFSQVLLKTVTFEHCVFDRAKFSAVQHNGCVFENCTFNGAEFSKCTWARETTIYKKCDFNKARITGSSMMNVDFSETRFDLTNAGLTFSGTVFEDCVFSGILSNCNFRGSWSPVPDRDRIGGFYRVDLSELSLDMVSFFDNFEFSSVSLPKNKTAILLPALKYAGALKNFAQANPTSAEASQVAITSLRLYGPGFTICSKTDLIELFGKTDGEKIFGKIECLTTIPASR